MAETQPELGGVRQAGLFLSFVCIPGPRGPRESPPVHLLPLVVSRLPARTTPRKEPEGKGQSCSELGSFSDLGAGLGGGQEGSRVSRCPSPKREVHSCAESRWSLSSHPWVSHEEVAARPHYQIDGKATMLAPVPWVPGSFFKGN